MPWEQQCWQAMPLQSSLWANHGLVNSLSMDCQIVNPTASAVRCSAVSAHVVN
jgi:hypothetical protein